MESTFEVEAKIARSVDAVWHTLTDWEHAHRWMRGIDWIRADGETAVGATLTFHTRGKDRHAEISECEDGRRITLRSTQGGVTSDYEYELCPIDPRVTRVTLVATCRSDALVWKALLPLIRLAIRITDGRQLEALKQVTEHG